MDLSIIIVNWNTWKVLRGCLISIKDTSGKLKVEIFVVDNDSSDGSRELIRKEFPDVHLINSGGNLGFAKANNLAIPHAKAPYILFLNPDTIVHPDAMRKMRDFLDDHRDTGVVSCRITDETGVVAPLPIQTEATPFKRFLIQIFFAQTSASIIGKMLPSQNPDRSGYVRNFYGPCLMIRKKVLDQVGYFDERFFMYAEDIDLCQRIHKKGWKLYYMTEVGIVHLGGQASDNAPKEFSIVTMCESISKLMSKNYGVRGETLYKLGVVVSSISRMGLLLFLMVADCVSGGKKILKHRQSFQKQRIMLNWSLAPSKTEPAVKSNG